MPSPVVTPPAKVEPPTHADTSPALKTIFWGRIGPRYAADPIADMAGDEATLRRAQDLLRMDQDVLEIGRGIATPASRLSPFTRRLPAPDVVPQMIDIASQGMDIVSAERRGTRGKDFRVFLVARKPA